MLTLANSVDKPSQTSLSQSHLEGRNILTKTDALDRVEGLQGNYLKKSKKKIILFWNFCGNSAVCGV